MASKPPVAGDLASILKTGDYRAQLEGLRDELVGAMRDSPAGAKAQTAAQIRAVLKDLESLPKANKVTVADDLAARRKDRRAKTAARASAAGSEAGG